MFSIDQLGHFSYAVSDRVGQINLVERRLPPFIPSSLT